MSRALVRGARNLRGRGLHAPAPLGHSAPARLESLLVRKNTWPRVIARWLGLSMLLVGSVLLVAAWPAFGHPAQGPRLARMERSPQWKDGQFHNPEPIINDISGMLTGLF